MKRLTGCIVLLLFLAGTILQFVEARSSELGQPIIVNYFDGPDTVITYSQTNPMVCVGQKLIIRRSSARPEGQLKSRFMTSGDENNFYNFFEAAKLEQLSESEKQVLEDGGVFVAKKAGSGKVKVVPNYSDWDRARELTVTVKDCP